ncbi:TrbC/VirB2 family protein [Burkholderia ambifaria]|uniref:TrbC/VirB2 family protein n=1 Tax=Burkholderia ambifaria TaxID=152480 RepID=UPI00158B51FA|nr:TrbC/VirB2 family protein [Burkholderia ambifaria]
MQRNNLRELLTRIKSARISKELAAAAATMFMLTGPAHAQFQQVQTTVNWVQVTFTAIAVSVLTIAFMWAGFKVMFKHERFMDQMHILGGAILIGGAAAAAAALS